MDIFKILPASPVRAKFCTNLQITTCIGLRVGVRGGHVTRIYAPSGGQTLLVSPFVAPHRKSPRAVICDANLEKERILA